MDSLVCRQRLQCKQAGSRWVECDCIIVWQIRHLDLRCTHVVGSWFEGCTGQQLVTHGVQRIHFSLETHRLYFNMYGKMWKSSDGDSHEERLFTRTMEDLYKGESLGSILLRSNWRDRNLLLRGEKKLMERLARFKVLVGEE